MQNKTTNIPKPNAVESSRAPSWKDIVMTALVDFGGVAQLKEMYDEVAKHPRARRGTNKHINAKVRQVLERHDEFARVEAGKWALAVRYSNEEKQALKHARRERYPTRRTT